MKTTLIALAVSVATIFVVLVIVDVLRRRNMDPVSRVADFFNTPTGTVVVGPGAGAGAVNDATAADA